ncbi:hypothetical protein J7297_04546 [Nakaseomyces glabratus]|nr:hypothetical protein J7296_04527 [Nakaseomyces glabratus]KAH7581870.1 hypothetical protein J7297_04546 [Nakaseomyces glabratus]
MESRIVSSAEQATDIRYSFLNTLDHFSCEYVRTLWLIQYLDSKCLDGARDEEALELQICGKAEYLNKLVEERVSFLQQYKQDLEMQKGINKRYSQLLSRKKGTSTVVRQSSKTTTKKQNGKKLLLKINLKKAYRRDMELEKKRKDYLQKSSNESKKREVKDANGDEERYCFCNDVSYGAMIACDNSKCEREWFHYPCIGMTKPPSGKWYCSEKCRLQGGKK